MSFLTTIATTELPARPQAIHKDTEASSKDVLVIYWDRVADAQVPTSGYILEMAMFGSLDF